MELLGSYIPDMYLETAKGPDKWARFIESAFKRVGCFPVFVSLLYVKTHLW